MTFVGPVECATIALIAVVIYVRVLVVPRLRLDLLYNAPVNGLQIRGQAEQFKEFDRSRGQIEYGAILARFVVARKLMVIIVVACRNSYDTRYMQYSGGYVIIYLHRQRTSISNSSRTE